MRTLKIQPSDRPLSRAGIVTRRNTERGRLIDPSKRMIGERGITV